MRHTLRAAFRRSCILAGLIALSAGPLCDPPASHAQPTADQVLTDVGLSPEDKQRVLGGELVSADLSGVSDRDLAFAIAFLVKTTPDALSKTIVAGDLIAADEQVKNYGVISPAGSLTDFEKLDLEGIDRSQVGDLWKFVFEGLLKVENLQLDTGNPLQEELADFLRCVRERQEPLVSGADGVLAVAAAEQVMAAITRNRWR